MLEREVIRPSTDLNLRLNSEFKFGPGEEQKHLYAAYNAQEKVLICSTKEDFKVTDAYFLGQIGNDYFSKGVVLFESFLELFKDYNFLPAEKEGRLHIILFDKGKDE